jgi:hypothetical protein
VKSYGSPGLQLAQALCVICHPWLSLTGQLLLLHHVRSLPGLRLVPLHAGTRALRLLRPHPLACFLLLQPHLLQRQHQLQLLLLPCRILQQLHGCWLCWSW